MSFNKLRWWHVSDPFALEWLHLKSRGSRVFRSAPRISHKPPDLRPYQFTTVYTVFTRVLTLLPTGWWHRWNCASGISTLQVERSRTFTQNEHEKEVPPKWVPPKFRRTPFGVWTTVQVRACRPCRPCLDAALGDHLPTGASRASRSQVTADEDNWGAAAAAAKETSENSSKELQQIRCSSTLRGLNLKHRDLDSTPQTNKGIRCWNTYAKTNPKPIGTNIHAPIIGTCRSVRRDPVSGCLLFGQPHPTCPETPKTAHTFGTSPIPFGLPSSDLRWEVGGRCHPPERWINGLAVN